MLIFSLFKKQAHREAECTGDKTAALTMDNCVQNDAAVKIPQHIAFIMDGNGRWAKKRGLARSQGHVEGAKTFKKIVEGCFGLGIKAVTVYAFSTENWKRPKEEVDAIMHLMQEYIGDRLSEEDSRYKIRFIGDREVFERETVEKLDRLESLNPNAEYILYIALNYGGRAEICYAVNKLIAQGKKEITQEDISSMVYTFESPDPDLIVRTGGDVRISNFLMWQSAYSELWFTRTLWPDLEMKEVREIVANYSNTERRFGGLV